jgi:hypothetical protein
VVLRLVIQDANLNLLLSSSGLELLCGVILQAKFSTLENNLEAKRRTNIQYRCGVIPNA